MRSCLVVAIAISIFNINFAFSKTETESVGKPCKDLFSLKSIYAENRRLFLWDQNWSNFFRSPQGPSEDIKKITAQLAAYISCAKTPPQHGQEFANLFERNSSLQIISKISQISKEPNVTATIWQNASNGEIQSWQFGSFKRIDFYREDGKIKKVRQGEFQIEIETSKDFFSITNSLGRTTQVSLQLVTSDGAKLYSLQSQPDVEISFEVKNKKTTLVTSLNGGVHLANVQSGKDNFDYIAPSSNLAPLISEEQTAPSVQFLNETSESTKTYLKPIQIEFTPDTGLVAKLILENIREEFDYDIYGNLEEHRVFFLEKTKAPSTKEEIIYRWKSNDRDSLSRLKNFDEEILEKKTTYNFEYDDRNRLEMASATGLLNWSHFYKYDLNGNRELKFVDSELMQEVKFNSSDQIVDVLGLGSDLFGNSKISETTPNRFTTSEINYVDENSCLLSSVESQENSGAKSTVQYYYTKGFLSPKILVKKSKPYFIVSDYLGSVKMVLDLQTGEARQILTYDDFGNLRAFKNLSFQKLGFAGSVLLGRNGNSFLCRRIYSPTFGRFLKSDDIHIYGGRSNTYQYAFNDPVNYSDPTGRNPFAAIARAIGGAAKGAGGAVQSAIGRAAANRSLAGGGKGSLTKTQGAINARMAVLEEGAEAKAEGDQDLAPKDPVRKEKAAADTVRASMVVITLEKTLVAEDQIAQCAVVA